MEDDLNQIKKCLRSVLISCPEGTPLNKVESDYKSFMGIPLDYRRLGFRSIESFLSSIPDTARLQGNIVFGVSCAEIKHVTKLINNQRKVTSNVKRVQKARQRARQPPPAPAPTYRPSSGPSKFAWGGQPRLGTPIHQHFHPMRPPMAYGPPPPAMRQGPPPQRAPPLLPFPHVPPNFQQVPPPPQEDELIFSEEEIFELLTKENIPISPPLSHILSLTFPYIYRGSHVTILDLDISLCKEIATAVAIDCEEELEGSPAVIVCKMFDSQDLALLEASHKVESFKTIAKFEKTKVKVITIKFQDLIHLLNMNNVHFYQQTTFIIFVDIDSSRMTLLSTMLPSELQYLFLSTCCDPGENSRALYKQPQIVIAKDSGHYRDFANNGEKVIEHLARKLAILNTRHPPQQPLPSPSSPKGDSKQTSKIPQQTYMIPPQPQKVPVQPHNIPRQPHNIPMQPHALPQQPYNLPRQPNTLPQQPYNRPQHPNNLPQQPYNLPRQPYNLPHQPNTIPIQGLSIVPTPYPTVTQASAIPTQSIDKQPEANNLTNNTAYVNGAKPSDTAASKDHFPALKHLTESALKSSVNLLIQADPNKGKTTLLLEYAISKVDTSIDKLQIVITTPSPRSCSSIFLRLKEFVGLKENTEVRAFGYSEGSLDKLNAYLVEQKVHILVMDNAHFSSLVLKAPTITSHCKLIGCDELYGSHYNKQVPSSIKSFLEKVINSSIQLIVMTHPNEDEQLIHDLFPKPYWHIRQEESSKKRDKYTVSFLHQ